MAFLFAYRQKESILPEELRLKNPDVIFSNVLAHYHERLSKSAFLDDLKSTLS